MNKMRLNNNEFHFGDQHKFEIQSTINQKPFEDPVVRSFFTRWCEINDSIDPQVVTRKEFNNRGMQGILEKKPGGKQTLFIPEDLQLWEMIGVMEIIDKDTFAAKQERTTEIKEKVLALGKIFENAGVYIAERLDGIEDGKEIAEALALEFYQYGQSITHGKAQKTPQIDKISSKSLTPQETEAIDQFLAGDNLYKSRKQRIKKLTTEDIAQFFGGDNLYRSQKQRNEKLNSEDQVKNDELYEKERQKTLVQFFAVAEKAFAIESKNLDGALRESPTKLKPWQSDTPIHSAFLKRINRALTKQIETPKREFQTSIFRRGMELLQRNMPFDKLPNWVKYSYLHWRNGETTLREALKIDEMAAELDQIRKTGNTTQIAKKEQKIADKIQEAVSNFSYQNQSNNPSEMVASQCINCVGASMLGGALMKEAGLNYLVGQIPGHSILLLVMSDERVEWRDMLHTSFNEHITDEMISGQRKDGKPLTVNDIVEFSQKPGSESLIFDNNPKKLRYQLYCFNKGHQRINIFEPEYGQQIQVLNNTGYTLNSLGRYEEAIEAYRQAIEIDPKYADPYFNLGINLHHLYRYEEAIEAYRQAIEIDPKFAYAYFNLGIVLNYSLGRREEAIEAYQKFIELADNKNDYPLIVKAKQMIADLKK